MTTKILVIEDDPLMSRMYERIFSFRDYEVKTASNGKAGIQSAGEFLPDIILLDVMMPEMNGLEVLDTLKAMDNTKAIPVVMLTNLSDEENVKAALDKGAVKYIVKSEHKPKEVEAMVNEIVNGTPPPTA